MMFMRYTLQKMFRKFNTVLLFLTILVVDLDAQNKLFSIAAVKRYSSIVWIDTAFQIAPDSNVYYKIVRLGDPNTYPFYGEQPKIFSNIDTLEAIKELLSFQGDKRICVKTVADIHY